MWLSVAVFALSTVKVAEALLAWRLVRSLPEAEASAAPPLPRLSVVVPARNEERGLQRALPALIGQDYPDLEVVLVDDRSTDETGAVMRRLAAGREDVSVVRVEKLPEGWLGKNHAVHVGAQRAGGEWLLLTDADVFLRPGTLRRAVEVAEREGLDHLALVPHLELPGYWLRSFVAFFFTAFLIYRGYYRANLPASRVGVGIGAFNLVRRSAFDGAGGYAVRPLRPEDDLSLGRGIKSLGLRQRLMLGQDLLSVRWYESLGQMVRGVEKNVFPALDYSLLKVSGYSLGTLLFAVWPFVGVFLSGGIALALYLGAILGQVLVFVLSNRFLGWRVFLFALAYPVCALLFVAVLVRSTVLVLLRGGIYWRGTFYPLSALRGEW
jgi:glycosyltransferase involved in cell wall biosynthesis